MVHLSEQRVRIFQDADMGDSTITCRIDELCLEIQQDGESIFIPHELVPRLLRELAYVYERADPLYQEAEAAYQALRREQDGR